MNDDRPPKTDPPVAPKPFQFGLRTMMIVIAVVALVLGLTIPAFRAARETGPRRHCVNNLKQIGLALHNYHDTFKSFPPAYIPGPDGKPWQSWRILIAPYIEPNSIYDNYRFQEPWDGPNNRTLHQWFFYWLICPSSDQKDPTTSYLAIVGPGTAWPGAEPTRFEDFADGTANTIMVVEVVDSGIHWMEPRDLNVEDLFKEGNRGSGLRPSSNHRGGFNALFADGSVRRIPNDVAREKLMALLTPAGGEQVSLDDLAE